MRTFNSIKSAIKSILNCPNKNEHFYFIAHYKKKKNVSSVLKNGNSCYIFQRSNFNIESNVKKKKETEKIINNNKFCVFYVTSVHALFTSIKNAHD